MDPALGGQGGAAARLVGRDHSVAALGSALSDARAGSPRVVVVQGEAGMGKTALLGAFAERVVAEGMPLVAITCDPHEQPYPYATTSLLLDTQPRPDAPAPEAAGALLAHLSEIQPDSGAAVIFLDDVQWMDMQSVAAIRFALRRLRRDRVLVVLARRPAAGVDPWASVLRDAMLARTVELGPLSAGDVAALARRHHGEDLSATAAVRLAQATGGVPLFLSTLMLEASWETLSSPTAKVPVPSSCAALVLRAIEVLPAAARRLLEALAVLDEPAALVSLAAVSGVDDAAGALGELLPTGLLRADGTAETTLYSFTHAVIRAAVYDGTDPGPRRQMHQRAAGLSTGARSMHHRVVAADRADPGLAGELVAMAQQERREGRYAAAATARLQAREVEPDGTRRDALLLEALVDRLVAWDLHGATLLQPSAQACPPSALRSQALGLLARDTGQIAEAGRLLAEAVALAQREGSNDIAAYSSVELAAFYALLNRGEDGVRAATLGLTSPSPAVERAARAFLGIGLWSSDRLPEALQVLAETPPPAQALPEDAPVLVTRGTIRYYVGELTEAAGDLAAAVKLARAGVRVEQNDRAHVQLAMTLYQLGDWDAAAVEASKACALVEAGDRPWTAPLAYAASVMVPAGRGEWELAGQRVQLALTWAQRIGSPQALGLAMQAEVNFCSARGDHEGVLRASAPLTMAAHVTRMNVLRSTRWRIPRVRAFIALGRLDEAESAVREYEAVLQTKPEGPGPALAGLLRGLLAESRGDGEAARWAYGADLEDPAVAMVPFARAELLESLGRVERRLGSRRRAIDCYREAREVYVRLRAAPSVARCDAQLAACGLQQSAPAPLALTPREQDVATLVGRGLSNPEAAAELYLTPKTVEYHLGNIYAKLGINSRRQLRARMSLTAG